MQVKSREHDREVVRPLTVTDTKDELVSDAGGRVIAETLGAYRIKEVNS